MTSPLTHDTVQYKNTAQEDKGSHLKASIIDIESVTADASLGDDEGLVRMFRVVVSFEVAHLEAEARPPHQRSEDDHV